MEAVCCYDNGGLLLTAGRTIKLWNLEDYTMVKVGGASYHRDVSLHKSTHFFWHAIFMPLPRVDDYTVVKVGGASYHRDVSLHKSTH